MVCTIPKPHTCLAKVVTWMIFIVWRIIWGLEVTPKVRHFLWCLCIGTLPTRALLAERHMIEETVCPWCGYAVETSSHALFEFQRVLELWDDNGCADLVHNRAAGLCEMVVSWEEVNVKLKQRAAFLAWCIWGERNLKVFKDKTTPNAILLARVHRYVDEFGQDNKKIYMPAPVKRNRSSKHWIAPPRGIVKLNADASLADDGWAGLGVVARDDERKELFAATRRVRAWWPPEVAEAKALCFAVRITRKYGYEDVVLETDCQVVVNRLSKGAVYFSDLDGILEDILFLCNDFSSFTWAHVKRDGNNVAHHLAKLRPFGVE
ncbi:uncharacterized protein LOC110687708 [Chenopodium quinoa]|uniref:uncharacterized protein LOC110687708 n=1 Tax=Chenopodium quinoa TaxID=63459 RepID=UPI000B77FB64|nr:uncharacterized protein LOC110687708 [Chenopodium quinoa]